MYATIVTGSIILITIIYILLQKWKKFTILKFIEFGLLIMSIGVACVRMIVTLQ